MQILILTPIRLLGDGLARCLSALPSFTVGEPLASIADLRTALGEGGIDVVLVDVTQGIDFDEIRSIAIDAPAVALLALGLREQRQDVIRCGRAGFSGYVARDASIEDLAQTMADAVAGRLSCPAEISGSLMKALFRMAEPEVASADDPPLTHRERTVLHLIGRGCSNKEIARELQLSVATVKHHVHNLLAKLNIPRRAYAMRQVRERPWIAS